MSFRDAHARIRAHIWQAIAQQEIDLSGLDKQQVEALVEVATDAALLELDTTISEAETSAERSIISAMPEPTQEDFAGDPFDNDKEDILWEGRPFLSVATHYRVTDERVRIVEGLLSKRQENVELVRIQDIDYTQTFSERLLSLGDITIRSHDTSHPIIVLTNIKDPEAVYETLRRAVLTARKKHGFTYREEM